jgi:hypothetical protein
MHNIEFTLIVDTFNNFLSFFQRGQQHNDDRNLQLETKRQEALQAMSEALVKTHLYQDAQPLSGCTAKRRRPGQAIGAFAAMEYCRDQIQVLSESEGV